MADRDKTGILLTPYGTLSPPALATYERIIQAYKKEFPGTAVQLAFTSSLMRKRLAEKEGISVPGLLGALQELQDLGSDRVVVQSLQILPGDEFHQIARQVLGLRSSRGRGISYLELGMPLLCGLSDCRAVSSLLPAIIRRAGEIDSASEKDEPELGEAVVLVGHGGSHPADALYSLLARTLEDEHKHIFLGCIEGSLGLEELLDDLKENGAVRVLLVPFLLVAGGHAEKDIFGADGKSWKSILVREGYAVRSYSRGLGELPEILSIFLEHTRSALDKMSKQ